MGKKKPQKTKELLVAIAEASLTGGDEAKQQQSQPLTPKKRGRPRKIIEQVEGSSSQSKKAKVSEKDEEDKQEEKEDEQQQQKGKESEIKRVPSRSRASRRKSKPRKSSC